MINIIDGKSLNRFILDAQRRENVDDHLSDKERRFIVDAFKFVHPDVELPVDLTEAYVEVIS